MPLKQRCAVCHKTAIKALNLRCEHHPCFQCIKHSSYIKKLNSTKTNAYENIESKYQIRCPNIDCGKKTLTYDLQNLVMNQKCKQVSQNQEDCFFINIQFSSTKNQPAGQNYTQSYNANECQSAKKYNSLVCTKNNENNKKYSNQNSIISSSSYQSNYLNNSNTFGVKCQIHSNKILKYFCYDCYKLAQSDQSQKNYQQNSLLCEQCISFHSHTHNILTVGQSIGCISKGNEKIKQSIAKHQQKKILKSLSQALNKKKQTTIGNYINFEKKIDQEYKNVIETLNKQYSNLKQQLKSHFTDVVHSFNSGVQFLKQSKRKIEKLEKLFQIGKKSITEQLETYIENNDFIKSVKSLKNYLNKQVWIPQVQCKDWQKQFRNVTENLLKLKMTLQSYQNSKQCSALKQSNKLHKKVDSQIINYQSLASNSKKNRKKSCFIPQSLDKQSQQATTIRLDLKKPLAL